jgi:hypothetical protein
LRSLCAQPVCFRKRSVISEKVPVFFLPYLVAVFGIFFKKREVGIQLKGVTRIKNLVVQHAAARQVRCQFQACIVPAGLAALRIVDGAVKTDLATVYRPVRYLPRCVPFAGKAG